MKAPFPRISYDEAIEILQKSGNPAKWGDDFGGDEETILSNQYDRPVMVHRYPTAIKAFYMQPDAKRPDLALGFDMLASEGYGEIIGGGERISSYDLLIQPFARTQTSRRKSFKWYLDLAPLRLGAARRLRIGPGTHRGLDLRN